jgi:CheY-like chemotaxis protein
MSLQNSSTILIVDDDPVVQQFISDVARKVLGYISIGVSTLQDGIQIATAKIPAVIFFDFGLPDGTGREFCEELAKTPELRKVSKWLITGSKPLSWDTEEWEKLGVKGYLVKPVSIPQIITAIRKSPKQEHAPAV